MKRFMATENSKLSTETKAVDWPAISFQEMKQSEDKMSCEESWLHSTAHGKKQIILTRSQPDTHFAIVINLQLEDYDYALLWK